MARKASKQSAAALKASKHTSSSPPSSSSSSSSSVSSSSAAAAAAAAAAASSAALSIAAKLEASKLDAEQLAADPLPVPVPPKISVPPSHKRFYSEEDAPSSPRPYQDLWKEAFPVGTEWDQYDKVYDIDWDFSHLEKAFEQGGLLNGRKVFLFGCTEPQFISYGDVSKVIHIPAVVAVLATQPPSDKIGIKSVQMEAESVVSMKEMKMDWVPYIPKNMDYVSVERYKAQVFTLKCIQRRVALRNLKEERLKKYEYCLPYFYNPFKEEEVEPDTSVSIMYPFDDGKPPIVGEFDWEMDELEEFVESYVKEEIITEAEVGGFKEFIKKQVSAERKQQREAKAERKRKIEEMSAETREFYESIRFYKFYPQPSPRTPDISALKSPFINRYYGKANEVL